MKTLSDKVMTVCPSCGNGSNSPCEYCGRHWSYNSKSLPVGDVKEAIMKIFVWVTTEHAPSLLSSDVASEFIKVFGDKLI